jgi:hypothetical protein
MARPEVQHIVDEKQICRRCEKDLPITEFWKSSYKASGYLQYCKECTNLNRKEYRDRQKTGTTKYTRKFTKEDYETPEYKEHQRDRSLKRIYGISIEDYNLLFTNQDGSCAICKIHQSKLKRPLDVDHDHETGKVRGLLCSNCNTSLGLLKDSTELLSHAIKYLEKNKNISCNIISINNN